MKPKKITAEQIEQDCPSELLDLGKRIATHLDAARKSEEKAQQHYTDAAKCLADAKAICNAGGFKAFQEKFCPDIGRSRAYELFAMGTGKKTEEEVKANTRARQQRHRAKNTEQGVDTAAPTMPSEASVSNGHGSVDDAEQGVRYSNGHGSTNDEKLKSHEELKSEKPQKALKPPLAVASPDNALLEFNGLVARLLKIAKQKPSRFTKTPHATEELKKLASFFTDLAAQKEKDLREAA
jgi:hypothetical protein